MTVRDDVYWRKLAVLATTERYNLYVAVTMSTEATAFATTPHLAHLLHIPRSMPPDAMVVCRCHECRVIVLTHSRRRGQRQCLKGEKRDERS